MWYILGVIFVAFIFFFSFNSRSKAMEPKKVYEEKLEKTPTLTQPIDTIKAMYSKKDIEAKLKKLSKTPPPKDLAFGAKCYSKASPPETASYTCPTCGKKTLYRMKKDDYETTRLVQWGINACRNEIKNVKGINIKLDESQFCKNCSKNIKDPQLCLLVNIGNTKETTKVCDVNYMDIRLIAEFLNNELKHRGNHDEEYPLVNYIDRIQALLGVKLKE